MKSGHTIAWVQPKRVRSLLGNDSKRASEAIKCIYETSRLPVTSYLGMRHREGRDSNIRAGKILGSCVPVLPPTGNSAWIARLANFR